MLVNLNEVLSFDGIKKEIDQKVFFESVEYGGIQYEVMDEVRIKMTITNIGNREINLNGSLETTLVIPCSRCTQPVTYPLKTDFSKDMKFDDSGISDDVSYIDGYNLDLEKLVFNELIIAFPMKVVCKDDCKGICNQCGKNLNNEDCECENTDIDPRLAVLKDLFKEGL